MSEEKRIMDFLGIGNLKGNVHGQHLGKILSYLKMMKTERFDVTLSKLALTCSMGQRYVKENYIEGLANWGIVKLHQDGNALFWIWIGEKALNGKQSLAEISPPTETEKEENEEKPKKEIKKGYCPACGKKLKKNKKFCNEKCVREYYDKRKKEGKNINYDDVWNDIKNSMVKKEKK